MVRFELHGFLAFLCLLEVTSSQTSSAVLVLWFSRVDEIKGYVVSVGPQLKPNIKIVSSKYQAFCTVQDFGTKLR